MAQGAVLAMLPLATELISLQPPEGMPGAATPDSYVLCSLDPGLAGLACAKALEDTPRQDNGDMMLA